MITVSLFFQYSRTHKICYNSNKTQNKILINLKNSFNYKKITTSNPTKQSTYDFIFEKSFKIKND